MFAILPEPIIPYPLATKSKEVVPHEFAAPAGCYKVAILAGASYVLTNIPRVPIVAIVTSGPLIAVFTNEVTPPAIVDGVGVTGGMMCPAGVTTVGRPDTGNIILINEVADGPITVYVQLLHSWNSLGTAQQTTRI
jgi:hypothetical protein